MAFAALLGFSLFFQLALVDCCGALVCAIAPWKRSFEWKFLYYKCGRRNCGERRTRATRSTDVYFMALFV